MAARGSPTPPAEPWQAASRRSSVRYLTALAVGLVLGLAVLPGALVPSARAADPTSPGATCDERYPEAGPAGLDLRFGCIAAELLGHYTGTDDTAAAPRISAWLLPMGLALGALMLLMVVVRLVRRRAGAALAPATPEAWWQCPSCKSLNAEGRPACYGCRRPWSPDALIIPTAERPETRR